MLIDSSVWVDFARGRSHPHVEALKRAILARTAMTTDVVRLEVLAGGTDIRRMSAALDGCEDVMQLHRVDAEYAASIYRTCRRAGETIRSLSDCVVAAIAIRNRIPVLHNDDDFDTIARHTELEALRE